MLGWAIQTLDEEGYKELGRRLELTLSFYLFLPLGTSEEVVLILRDAMDS